MSLQDFSRTGESGYADIITIRGAMTPLNARVLGRRYHEEELSDKQFDEIIHIIKSLGRRPRVIITHDGPTDIVDAMWPGKNFEHSRTSMALQKILAAINKLLPTEYGTTWLFGHPHKQETKME